MFSIDLSNNVAEATLLHKLFREVYHQASKARRIAFWHPFPQRWHKSLLPPGWGGGGRKLGRTAQHSFGRNCGGGGRRSDCVLAITLIIFVLNWCWRMRWFVLWPFCWLHPLLHAHHHALHLFEQLFLWSPGCKEMGLLQKILETQKTIITMLQMQESRPQAQAQSWAPLLSMVSANYTSFIQDSSDHRDDIIYLYMYISIYFLTQLFFDFKTLHSCSGFVETNSQKFPRSVFRRSVASRWSASWSCPGLSFVFKKTKPLDGRLTRFQVLKV